MPCTARRAAVAGGAAPNAGAKSIMPGAALARALAPEWVRRGAGAARPSTDGGKMT
jgi:hypothetical protein